MQSPRLFRILALAAFILVPWAALHTRSNIVAHVEAAATDTVPLKVERKDPAIDRIVPAGAKLERVVSGFKWTEGPVWDHGTLFFAEIPSNSIRRWTPGQGVSIFLQPSGYKGKTPYGGPEPGTNGMTLDARGRLTVAGHALRDVFRFESLNPHGTLTILADSYKGKRLNSPNDVVYRSDGSLYFTDPPYGLRTQSNHDPEKQLDMNGVYRIPHALQQKPGSPPDRAALQLLVSDLNRPNGIAFSPDEKYLYVDNTEPQKLWMRYTVKPDGTLTDALGRRDALRLRHHVLTTAADAAAGAGQYGYSRQLRSELKMLSALSVGDLRSQADQVAQELRALDVRIQKANWEIELLD